jgi:hypothetical protein
MLRILGLSALGLFLLAGSSPAQEPAAVGAGSGPVVQTVTSGGPTYSNRRFGLFRGNGRFFRRNNNTVNTTSRAMADTTAQTPEPTTKPEPLPAPKPTTKPAATETTSTTTTAPVMEPTTNTSNRRFLRRDGGLLSRLGARFGR